jgi:protein-disulfide isomerase
MSASRIAIVVLSLGCAGLAYLAFGGAPEAEIDQARIDAAVQAAFAQQRADAEAASDTRVVAQTTALLRDPDSPVLGNPNGDVTIVEFFDYTCSFCKAADPRVKGLLAEDSGVKLILKEYPILTPESLIATKAAFAALEQGKYEPFHNALMSLSGQLTEERIFDVAEEVGLDVERLRHDMENPEIAEEIIENFNLARALRISQTPTYIIDGHILTQASAEIDFPAEVAAARMN